MEKSALNFTFKLQISVIPCQVTQWAEPYPFRIE